MTTAKTKVRRAKKAVRNNPATTTGGVGVVLAIIGRYVTGLDAQAQLDLATLYLILVPAVKTAVDWWKNRQPPDEE
jgi:hypothetical protein